MRPRDSSRTAFENIAQNYAEYLAELASTNNTDDGIEVAAELLNAALGDCACITIIFPLDHGVGDARRHTVELVLGIEPERPHVDSDSPVLYVPINTVVAKPGESAPYAQIEFIHTTVEQDTQPVDALKFTVPAAMPFTPKGPNL